MEREQTMTDNAERFWTKVAIGTPDECWEWQAAKFRGGYGKFGIGPRECRRIRDRARRAAA